MDVKLRMYLCTYTIPVIIYVQLQKVLGGYKLLSQNKV
jgi:hypothetical protein